MEINQLRIVIATRNAKKLAELNRVVGEGAHGEWQWLDLSAYPLCPEVVEDGDTFSANADKKALTVARFTGELALADDSGLEVDGLGGAPGVYSARYAGPEATDAANVAKLLADLQGQPVAAWRGRFVCVLSLATPEGEIRRFRGEVEGVINAAPRGHNGFGYDPVFVPLGHDRTFAEMSATEKDGMSHRGRALAALAQAMGGGDPMFSMRGQ